MPAPTQLRGFRAPAPRPLREVYSRVLFQGGKPGVFAVPVQTQLGPAFELRHPALVGEYQTTVHERDDGRYDVFVGDEDEYRLDAGKLSAFISFTQQCGDPGKALNEMQLRC